MDVFRDFVADLGILSVFAFRDGGVDEFAEPYLPDGQIDVVHRDQTELDRPLHHPYLLLDARKAGPKDLLRILRDAVIPWILDDQPEIAGERLQRGAQFVGELRDEPLPLSDFPGECLHARL